MTEGESKLPDLPRGWMWTRFDQILDKFESGGRPKGGSKNIETGIPSIGGEHLTYDGRFNFSNVRYVPVDFFKKMNRGKIKREDILIVKDGATTGKTSIIRDDFPFSEAAVNEHVFLVRPFQDIDKLFVFYYLYSSDGQDYVRKNFRGTAQGGIAQSFFVDTFLPLPPLSEQRRIVAKIEELLTRLDAGVEALKKIQLQLKRYRQSVLKSAFSGKLTAEWRKAHKGEFEPASALLEKIKEERKKSGKYKELALRDTTDLPELPDGWVWARLNDLKQSIQYGTSEKANNDTTGIPIVRMGNIQDGKLVFENLKYLPHTYPQLADFILEDGDILFNRTNSAELVGKTATYRGSHLNAIFASYLIRIKVNNEVCIPDLITYFINSFYGRSYIGSVVSQQVGQANLNGTKLALMPIPLLSFAEQKKIVDEIDRHFSIADEIEATVEQSLKQADRLRQSILKKAFEGKLVPQNPDDEPAEKLLERIKAEKIKIAQKYLKE